MVPPFFQSPLCPSYFHSGLAALFHSLLEKHHWKGSRGRKVSEGFWDNWKNRRVYLHHSLMLHQPKAIQGALQDGWENNHRNVLI